MLNDLLCKQLDSEKYYNIEDLRMNRKLGIMLSSKELSDYLVYKENSNHSSKISLSLLAWNTKELFYFKSNELKSAIQDYRFFFNEDVTLNTSSYVDRNIKEIELGIICSELEGTLKIEGVNTTRRQIESIIKTEKITDQNSRIILNMYKGLQFVFSKPKFNAFNLKKLYDILSYECLSEDNRINDDFYRNDSVYVGDYRGCQVDKIEECMNSLFDYVNESLGNNKSKPSVYDLLLPFIVHYYIVYVHPYFDYNGRCARMVQIWMFMLLDNIPSLYLSEAINDNRNSYYKALENTRNTRNDLSYFLIYLIKLCNSYYVVHKNIDLIKSNIESSGESITNLELHYLKRILLNRKIGWFNYKAFISFAGLDVSKQGALKTLNNFEKLNILESKINSSKEKVFILRDELIEFELK